MLRRVICLVYLLLLLLLLLLSFFYHSQTGSRLLLLALGLGLGGGLLIFRPAADRLASLTLTPARTWQLLIAVVLLSLALRVTWLVLVPTDPVSDFQLYHELAVGLASSGTFDSRYVDLDGPLYSRIPPGPTMFVMPGYPLLLSLGYRFFGPTPVWGYALNLLFTVGLQLALFFVLRQQHSAVAGLLAAAGVGVHPTLVVSSSLLGTDLPGAALLALSVAAVWVATRRPGHTGLLAAIGAGLALGMAVHCRPFLVLLLPALALLAYLWTGEPRPQRRVAGLLAGLLLGVTLTLGPWVYRNYLVFGQPIFSSTANVVTLYFENSNRRVTFSDPWDPVVNQTDELAMRQYARAAAAAWVRHHPSEFLLRGLQRLGQTFYMDGVELRWTGVRGREGQEMDLLGRPLRRTLTGLFTLWWGVLLGALLAGCADARCRQSALYKPQAWTFLALGLFLLLLICAAVFTAVGQPRYHLVWVPFAYATVAVLLLEYSPSRRERLPEVETHE